MSSSLSSIDSPMKISNSQYPGRLYPTHRRTRSYEQELGSLESSTGISRRLTMATMKSEPPGFQFHYDSTDDTNSRTSNDVLRDTILHLQSARSASRSTKIYYSPHGEQQNSTENSSLAPDTNSHHKSSIALPILTSFLSDGGRPSSVPQKPMTPPYTPTILPNGRPLKPSLKSSHPRIETSQSPPRLHLRTRSAPSLTNDEYLGSPKVVHFADNDEGLTSVRLFKRTGKPTSVSRPPDDETETETEGEAASTQKHDALHFPRLPPTKTHQMTLEIDHNKTSAIPPRHLPLDANVYLEKISLESPAPPTQGSAPQTLLSLTGTVLVRNFAYEKSVIVRFTLDDWEITSEVPARYVSSLPELSRDGPGEKFEGRASPWDRFEFAIRLDHCMERLHEKILLLVVRFSIGSQAGGGEWWDNNGGMNYRVGFRATPVDPSKSASRRIAVSAPGKATFDNPQTRSSGLPNFQTFVNISTTTHHAYKRLNPSVGPLMTPPTSPHELPSRNSSKFI